MSISNDDLLSEEEYSVNLKDLQAEWDKAKPSNTHIKLLLRHLHQNRKRWMTYLPDGKFQPIIEAYPCFSEGQRKDDITEIDLLVGMEKDVAVDKGRSKETKSIISVHKVDDVASVKEAFFQSKEFTSPPLIIVVNKDDNSFTTAFIVGDRTKIACQAASILDAAVMLLAAYDVFDQSYPDIDIRMRLDCCSRLWWETPTVDLKEQNGSLS